MVKRRNPSDRGDRLFYVITYTIVTLLFIIVLYPLIYIVSSSFSSALAVTSGRVFLWPVDFSLDGYKAVFENKSIWSGYKNSAIYTLVGTIINLIVTLACAYPLSRKELPGRTFFSFLFAFTMFFNGGMIPSYILVKDLKMLNSIWALVIPGAMSVYNMIIVRTYMQNIPHELFEAAQIDGCNDFKLFSAIVLPLCAPVLAVITLYYAVGHWNAYFNAFMYLSKRELYPLQLILREILVMNSMDSSMISDPSLQDARMYMAGLIKYALIIVATVPMLVIFPFVQKFFVKGVMIGSIKG